MGPWLSPTSKVGGNERADLHCTMGEHPSIKHHIDVPTDLEPRHQHPASQPDSQPRTPANAVPSAASNVGTSHTNTHCIAGGLDDGQQ